MPSVRENATCSAVSISLREKVRPARREVGVSETKFALLAKTGRFWGVLRVLGEFCPAWALMEPSRANFVAPVGRDGAGVKEKPPLREVLWGAVKYSSPRHAEKRSILPILSEQGRYFFH